jgi:hypothetical protein
VKLVGLIDLGDHEPEPVDVKGRRHKETTMTTLNITGLNITGVKITGVKITGVKNTGRAATGGTR